MAKTTENTDVAQEESSKISKQNAKRLDQLGSQLNNTQLYLMIVIVSVGFNCWLNWNQTSAGIGGGGGSDSEIQKLQEKIATLQNKLHIARTKPATSKDELREHFSLNALIDKARRSTPTIWFSSNESNTATITEVAKKVISEDYYSCQLDLDVQFDPYKNCFRDLSIEFHNQLSLKIDNSHFFTSVGRVQYSFLITTMLSKRNEYMFGLGEIVFEVIEYPQLITASIPDTEDDDKPENETLDEMQHSNIPEQIEL